MADVTIEPESAMVWFMEDNPNWKQSVYETLVTDPIVQGLVWKVLESAKEDAPLRVSPMDVATARRYLRKCILNMSAQELASLQPLDAAALWAKGAMGAAQYRRRSHPASGERRVPRK